MIQVSVGISIEKLIRQNSFSPLLEVVLFCCLQEDTNLNALLLRLVWIYMRTRVKFKCLNKIEAMR